MQQLQRILEDGGVIDWRGKYMLSFAESNSGNPLLEWQGYVVDRIDVLGYSTVFKTQRLSEALDCFIELIEKEV